MQWSIWTGWQQSRASSLRLHADVLSKLKATFFWTDEFESRPDVLELRETRSASLSRNWGEDDDLFQQQQLQARRMQQPGRTLRNSQSNLSFIRLLQHDLLTLCGCWAQADGAG
ncbi:unnamed protein product [Effrenium voratum]|nr:unnamed protein product [Effrenium voratum]